MRQSSYELFEAENGFLVQPRFLEENRTDWESLFVYQKELRRMMAERKGRWMLLSDISVYGRVFGTPHALKERELGYAEHLLPDDRSAWGWRLTEHLFLETAKEEGVFSCVARIPVKKSCEAYSGAEKACLKAAFAAAKDRQVYNVNFPGDGPACGPGSPLAPLPVIPDTSKLETEKASDLEGKQI